MKFKYKQFKYAPLFLALNAKLPAFEEFPKEFADFYTAREENIKLFIAGEEQGQNVKATVTIDSFRLDSEPTNIEKLRTYLQGRNLTNDAVSNIEKTLLAGITDVLSCEGALTLCMPKNIPGQASYVFDIDAKELKAYVPSDLLKAQSTESQYHSAFRSQSALINNASLYTYSTENDSQFTWNNNAILGLPFGHLLLDTQYTSNDDALELYQALYDLEIKNVRALLGYQEFNRINLNTTDFLGYSANFSGTALTVGSSNNLLKGGTENSQRIYFFAPEAGQLEVYRGDRLLLTRAVNNGQQFISYDELPKGIYNITIVIKRGDMELLNEQRQIVNHNKFSLPLHRFDYRAELGYLDNDNSDEINALYGINNKDRLYWRGALSYRAAESLLLGTGFTGNNDSLSLQIGGYWTPHSNVNLQYTSSLFDSGANTHSAQIGIHPFSLSARKVRMRDFDGSLNKLLYSDDDYVEWSVGVSGSLLGGTSFLSYNSYQYDNEDAILSDNQTFSASWSRELLGGNFSIGLFHTEYDNDDSEWSTSLSWSRSFGEKFSARFSGYTDNDDDLSMQTSASYRIKGEQWQASTTAGVRVTENETITDLAGNLSGNTKHFQYSAYGFINSENDRSLSGTLSGTQVISKSGVNATYKSGKSFVSIDSKLTSETERQIKVNYQFRRNGKPWQKGEVDALNSEFLAIAPYNEIGVYLDADRYDAEVAYSGDDRFIMPGMHYQITTEVTPLETQLVVFNDFYGKEVNFVQCNNASCKGVEQVSEDGVYRVKYAKGENFALSAPNMRCLYDESLLGQNYILSSCLTDVQIAQRNTNTLNNFASALEQSNEKKISDQQLAKIMVRVKEIQDQLRLANGLTITNQ